MTAPAPLPDDVQETAELIVLGRAMRRLLVTTPRCSSYFTPQGMTLLLDGEFPLTDDEAAVALVASKREYA